MRRLLPLLFLCTGCLRLFPAPVPMASLRYLMPDREGARCLVVLLPGAGDSADVFRQEGFIDALQTGGVSVDIVAADATLGYYLRGTNSERLQADVLGPGRVPGYEQVWMIGISMGGFGTLDYSQRHAIGVDGVFAMAPYLGNESLGEEIKSAGGLAKWRPDLNEPFTEDNYQRQMWSWLHRVVTKKQEGPAIYVGFGDEDGLAPQDAVLGEALPRNHVFHSPGGHDWRAWRNQLEQFLQASDFRDHCGDQ